MSYSGLKCVQVFGDKGVGEEPVEADLISAIEFDETGDCLAIGDRGGRIVILKKAESEKKLVTRQRSDSRKGEKSSSSLLSGSASSSLGSSPPSTSPTPSSPGGGYRLFTEFQSHEPEFDYLKSVEIEEKINAIRWLKSNGLSTNRLMLLTTNDKTIKLWRVRERRAQTVTSLNLPSSPTGKTIPLKQLRLPRVSFGDPVVVVQPKKVFANGHAYHINSLSLNSDGETFLSADDLRVNLWNLRVTDESFNIVDMKPPNLDDLSEVITSASFHPRQCNLFAYSTSRGVIRLVDMRQSALCDSGARVFEAVEEGPRSFLSDIVCSISDTKFSPDGRFIISRDYLSVKLWDSHMESKPLKTVHIHEHIRPKLCELYDSDVIFDKFDVSPNRECSHFVAGSYGDLFYVYDFATGRSLAVVEASKTPSASRRRNSRARMPIGSPTGPIPIPSAKGISSSGGSAGSSPSSSSPSSSSGMMPSSPSSVGSSGVMSEAPVLEEGDFKKKVLHVAWHPTENTLVCTSAHHLFVYTSP